MSQITRISVRLVTKRKKSGMNGTFSVNFSSSATQILSSVHRIAVLVFRDRVFSTLLSVLYCRLFLPMIDLTLHKTQRCLKRIPETVLFRCSLHGVLVAFFVEIFFGNSTKLNVLQSKGPKGETRSSAIKLTRSWPRKIFSPHIQQNQKTGKS